MKKLKHILTTSTPIKRQYHVFILLTTIAISLAFLWGAPLEPPMTDSYIHFEYARNLALHGELSYNPGVKEGMGSSSFFWVVVLALFQTLGFSPLIMSKVLGISFLFLSGILVFELSLKVFGDHSKTIHYLISAGFSILGVLSGSMVWIALSGMETMLFLMLGLLSIWLYTRESWILMGLTLGLLTLTRIEGITLAGLLVLIELIRSRRITTTVLKIIIPLTVVLAPWFIYIQIREGVPVSSSFQGRQYVVSAVEERITNQFPFLYWVQKIHPLIHFVCWAYFIFTFVTGSVSLPGLDFSLGGNIVGTELTIPLAGIVIFCLCLPLIILALKKIWHSTRFRSLQNPDSRLRLVLLSWFFLFNLAYALFLPRVGSAGRYATINQIAFWISLLLGTILIKKAKIRALSVVFVLLLFGTSLNYWRVVYRANVDYMGNVPKKAAVFFDANYPPETPIGATDLGAIGYYSQQPVVDLFGYINQDLNKFMENGGNTADYLAKEHLCYLLLYASVENAGLDFTEEMGLTDDPRFSLSLEQSYTVSVAEWELGNGPLRNYMPAVNIYRVNWQDQTRCQ
ncbi:MAG TPA: hypothetical protein VLA32_01580 [Anaerolineales bacterium]|nr:hypothetical protein [Anaerolineales bacterium]